MFQPPDDWHPTVKAEYFQEVAELQRLFNKSQENIKFTHKELIFLYQVNKLLLVGSLFDYSEAQRLLRALLDQRDFKQDMADLLHVNKEEVATEIKGINEKVSIYFGSDYMDVIFNDNLKLVYDCTPNKPRKFTLKLNPKLSKEKLISHFEQVTSQKIEEPYVYKETPKKQFTYGIKCFNFLPRSNKTEETFYIVPGTVHVKPSTWLYNDEIFSFVDSLGLVPCNSFECISIASSLNLISNRKSYPFLGEIINFAGNGGRACLELTTSMTFPRLDMRRCAKGYWDCHYFPCIKKQ